ncbi:helix-turn-helix domain-containing protein [[Limnothrix rosea] IAM M-220]|uniref:helix-turn-helix domain-containing protein n=1 Tax=[Limnothrix rosea] IAM M-220 TaxID=454133 RepID=UPI0009647D51|nr:transcriptional regulator [[Limnothrix rosea] IAM M-220]OKH18793.1 transcriptional regulator [[Limnothrix rosea] IAM M-220]
MSVLESPKYIELITSFPPRPIKSEADYDAVQNVIDDLLDNEQITPDIQDYLNILSLLIQEYEKQAVSIPNISGLELLKGLIEEWNLKQKDLVPIFKTESIVSDVLNEKRKFTVEHLEKLGEFFNISPAAFL